LPGCLKRAIESDDTIVVEDPRRECPECPISNFYDRGVAWSRRLAIGERVFGVLSVSITRHFSDDPEGRQLFEELAKDLAYALQRIEDARTLKETELRFQRMLDLVPDMISIHDPEMNIIYSNWKEYGAVPKEKRILGEKCYRVYRNLDEICPDCQARRIFETKKPIQLEVKLPEGPWIDLRVIPLLDEQGEVEYFMEWVRDITENKKAEDAYSRVCRLATDLICVADINSAAFVQVNPAFEKVLGYSEEELLGRSFLEFIHPEDVQKTIDVISRELQKGKEVIFFENRYRRKDGSYRYLEWNSHPIADEGLTFAIAHDITERKLAEEALLEAEWKFRALFENGPLAVAYHRMIYDKAGSPFDYFFIDTNRQYQELTGIDPRGKTVREAFPGIENDPFDWIGTFGKVARTGETIRFQQHLQPNDRWYDCVGYQYKPDHFVAAFMEITEQKRAEQEKEQLEVQYRQAQKMEAIGQLTGGVAHDFNNLLQVINAGTEMALQDLAANHPAQEILGEVFKAGERAARLVSQLLAFSRRQIMQPEVLDLNKVVTDLLKMLQRIIGEHIRLEWIPGRRLGNVHGDLSMLEQTLFNLCVNARDAMQEGGVLTVETQNVLIDSDYCASHAWAVPGRFILLSVTDTGCGMQQEILEHIFEPFFTTKEASRGTGLGLATVYGIVKQHEGMVNVYSEPGKGSTFKIYLPACETKADRIGTLIQGPVKGGRETILLAEDDESVRDLAQRILEKAGYTVLSAKDGRDALEIFKQHSNKIALVLLDVVMPEMGGREAYEAMKVFCPGLKALFASGYSENAIHTNFVLDRGLALLPKPYAPDTLLRKIREVLDQSPSGSE
jgi:two-component system, cell cycle sensor histidine kinase and response regulator CckA